MEFTHSHWHWFWIVPFLFMVLMCFVAGSICRRRYIQRGASGSRNGWGPCGCWGDQRNSETDGWSQTASQVLDRRYASGEITKEQYEQMKRDLSSIR